MRRRVRGPVLNRTRHIFCSTYAFKSASNGGTQNWHNSSSAGSQICSTVQWRVSAQTRDLGHFKLLKVRKVTFTMFSQTLSKNCPWGKNNNTTRAPTSAPPSAAKFSLASKAKTIQKRLSKPFKKSLLTNILTTSASNIFSSVCD